MIVAGLAYHSHRGDVIRNIERPKTRAALPTRTSWLRGISSRHVVVKVLPTFGGWSLMVLRVASTCMHRGEMVSTVN